MLLVPAVPLPFTITVPGGIRGKGRHRARAFRRKDGKLGVQAYADEKTVTAENWVKACAIETVGQPVLDGALSLTVRVIVAIPKSWPKYKRADAIAGRLRPTVKPDASNIAKLVEDALNQIVWDDDVQIVDLHVSKFYGTEPCAVLTVSRA